MKPRVDRSMWVPVALAVILAIGAPAPAALGQESKAEKEDSGPDTVHVFNKERTAAVARKGEILEETPAQVKLRTSDGEKTYKREDIKEVSYGGLPPGLTQAELQIGKNDFEGAAATYKKIAEDCDGGKARPIFKPRALLGAARAYVNAGKFDAAAEAYLAAVKAGPKSIYVRDAYREGVRAWIRAKNPAKAQAMAGEAKAGYKTAELPEEAQDEAQLLSAEADEAGGNVAKARSTYNLLTNSRDGKVRGRALLGAARAAFLAKEVERAEGQYRQILSEKDVDRAVRCGAARGLGDAIMSRPGVAKDFQKLRAAATAYSQAVAVHFPARGEPTDDREASLHEAAKVYDSLADLSTGEKDAKAREVYSGVARQLREELVRLYKTSQYRAENEQKLAKAPDVGTDTPK